MLDNIKFPYFSSKVNRVDALGLVSLAHFIKSIQNHLDHDETNHEVTDDRLKAMCQYTIYVTMPRKSIGGL